MTSKAEALEFDLKSGAKALNWQLKFGPTVFIFQMKSEAGALNSLPSEN